MAISRLSSAQRIAVMLLTLFAAAGCGEYPRPRGVAVGQAFPDAALVGLMDGRPASLASYRGRALIINFWATWCEPCRREMPSLERLSRIVDPQRVAVLGVTVDADTNLAREFVLKYRLTFPNFSDGQMKLWRDALGVPALPETFLVTPDGRLAARFVGARDWASPEMARSLNAALGTRIAL